MNPYRIKDKSQKYIFMMYFYYLGLYLHQRRQWQPTPVLLSGKSHGREEPGSPWGREESDATERLHFTFHFYALEKEMATHSTVLAWRIPGMEEPGRLQSMGSLRAISLSLFTFMHWRRK